MRAGGGGKDILPVRRMTIWEVDEVSIWLCGSVPCGSEVWLRSVLRSVLLSHSELFIGVSALSAESSSVTRTRDNTNCSMTMAISVFE